MKLYRFEKLEEVRCNTIANKQLWISSPKEFNDLNDCRLPAIYMAEFTDEDFDKLQRMIEILYPENCNYENPTAYKKLIGYLKGYIKDAKNSDLSAKLDRCFYVNSIRQEIINSVGICCFFSGGIDEPLLWAHYADNHKGFCVEYEYDGVQNTSIHPVNYQTVPRIPSARELLLCLEESLTRIFTSKTMHWQYEKEYRLIQLLSSGDANSPGKPIDLPPNLKPVRIITGIRLEDDQELLKGIELQVTQFNKLLAHPY